MQVLFFSLAVSLILLFQGCATKNVEVKERTLVFPAYPDKPRILYLHTYRGYSKPEKEDISFIDVLLGETATTKASNPTIVKPYGVGLLDGEVYAVDTATRLVFIINEETNKVRYLGKDVRSKLGKPVSIAFDKDKITYVSDAYNNKILGFDKNGEQVISIGDRLSFVKPTGIAIDKKLHRLYVVDTKAHHIKVFDLKTLQELSTIGKRGHKDGEFNFPTNIAIDRRNSNIVVTDTQNFRVQIFDKDGKFIRKFGKVGDRPGEFARPKGIGVDSEGHIYVTDASFNNIQVFSEEGALMTYFGGAGYSQPGTFRLIAGLYIDEDDKIIVADGFSGRVQTFQYMGEAWQKKHPAQYKKLSDYLPQSIVEKTK